MPETPEILQMKMLAAAEKKDKGEERWANLFLEIGILFLVTKVL